MSDKVPPSLTWGQLSKFTWGELSNFTWGDLKNGSNALLKDIENEKIEVPYSVYIKIKEICDELSIKDTRLKRRMTTGEACAIISLIINILDKLPDISKKFTPILIDIIEKIVELFKHS